MFVPGPGAQIVRPNAYQTRSARPPDNSIIKRFAKVIREDRDDIDAKRFHYRLPISNCRFSKPLNVRRFSRKPSKASLPIGNRQSTIPKAPQEDRREPV